MTSGESEETGLAGSNFCCFYSDSLRFIYYMYLCNPRPSLLARFLKLTRGIVQQCFYFFYLFFAVIFIMFGIIDLVFSFLGVGPKN